MLSKPATKFWSNLLCGNRNCTLTLDNVSPCCHEEPKQGGTQTTAGPPFSLVHRSTVSVRVRVHASVCACVHPSSLISLPTPRASQSAWLTAVSVNVSKSPSTSGPSCLQPHRSSLFSSKPLCRSSLPSTRVSWRETSRTVGTSVLAWWTGWWGRLQVFLLCWKLEACPFPKELKFVWASSETADCCRHLQPVGAGP